ncbi:MAG: permease [Phycisphaerae bacterium]|nr:permease [Phycisphaerae bacterium]
MSIKSESKKLLLIVTAFLVLYFLPVGTGRFDNAIMQSLLLVKWYAREHVLLCLVPAFFIAGAISVFVSQASVMKYLGAKANKFLAYGVASISGTILAVCSCTVLPLFAGIYKMGAGLGPACAFLYSGPAINVLAIILTARILGFQLGLARAVGAIAFSVIIGLLMHFIYRKEEIQRADNAMAFPEDEKHRPLWQNSLYFASMVAVLVFANWAKPIDSGGVWAAIYSVKWIITAVSLAALIVFLALWFSKKDLADWTSTTWDFSKQILPLLFAGVIASGFLLGTPSGEGVIPSKWVSAAVGGNSFRANFFASVVAAFMYFATLTEVPILQGLINAGMGKGPALALLLAGPALSLPSMLVLRSIMGTQKTVVYVSLVIVMATISGMFFGAFF